MVEPVSLNGSDGQPPKPFFESPILFCAIEAITLVATRKTYRSTNSATFSLVTFIMGTGFAIKPYTVWNGFITFLNFFPDSSTNNSGQRAIPKSQQSQFQQFPQQQRSTSGQRAVPKSQQSQQPPRSQPPATVFTNSERAQPKKKK